MDWTITSSSEKSRTYAKSINKGSNTTVSKLVKTSEYCFSKADYSTLLNKFFGKPKYIHAHED